MDPWLTSDLKWLLYGPCLSMSNHVDQRLSERTRIGKSIDERALTEDVVDMFDTYSTFKIWGDTIDRLKKREIYLNFSVQKSSQEYKTGADIGIIINRAFRGKENTSQSEYACLIQCKKIDEKGQIADFYHKVPSTGLFQSQLLLNVTCSSYYFIYTPSTMIHYYPYNYFKKWEYFNYKYYPEFYEIIDYCRRRYGYYPFLYPNSIPTPLFELYQKSWFSKLLFPLKYLFAKSLSPNLYQKQYKDRGFGILVVPAVAVEAQKTKDSNAFLEEIIPNSLPFWYWFCELLLPGFIGDRNIKTIQVAQNVKKAIQELDIPFNVRYSVRIGFRNILG